MKIDKKMTEVERKFKVYDMLNELEDYEREHTYIKKNHSSVLPKELRYAPVVELSKELKVTGTLNSDKNYDSGKYSTYGGEVSQMIGCIYLTDADKKKLKTNTDAAIAVSRDFVNMLNNPFSVKTAKAALCIYEVVGGKEITVDYSIKGYSVPPLMSRLFEAARISISYYGKIATASAFALICKDYIAIGNLIHQVAIERNSSLAIDELLKDQKAKEIETENLLAEVKELRKQLQEKESKKKEDK